MRFRYLTTSAMMIMAAPVLAQPALFFTPAMDTITQGGTQTIELRLDADGNSIAGVVATINPESGISIVNGAAGVTVNASVWDFPANVISDGSDGIVINAARLAGGSTGGNVLVATFDISGGSVGTHDLQFIGVGDQTNSDTVVSDDSASPIEPDTTDGTYTVTASNTLPSAIVITPSDSTPDEGSQMSISGSWTDPDADNWDVTISWGDGSSDTVINNLTSRSYGPVNHTYEDGGNPPTARTITVTVNDGTGSANNTTDVDVRNVAPTVNAGGPYMTAEGTTVMVMSTATDPAGVNDSLTFAWDLDSNGSYETSGQSVTFDATGLNNGTYQIRARAVDDDGFGGVSNADVIVSNVAPTANIGGPYSVDEGETVSLNAGGSSDPVDSLTFAWDLDNDSQFDDATGATPDFDATSLNDGSYPVSVRVNDGDDTSDAMISVTVNNVSPTPDIGGPYSVNEGSSVMLDASGSSDPVDTLQFLWDFDDDAEYDDGTGAMPTFDAATLDNGVYPIELRLSDDDASILEPGSVTVNNVAPTADIGGPYSVDEGQSITLDASGSSDPVDDLTFTWDLNGDLLFDDATGEMPTFDASALDNGSYSVRVRVNDGDTETGDTEFVTVNNVAPTADIGGPYTVDEGSSIVLDASGSSDPIDDLTFSWDLDDDSQFDDATGEMPTFDAASLNDGSYPIGVRVNDGDDSTDALISVTVQNVAPTADIGGPYTVEVDETVILDASGSSDPFDSLTFAWEINDDDQFDDASTASVEFDATGLTPGMYPVAVRVSDDDETVLVTAMVNVILTNVDPTALSITPLVQSVNEGTALSLSGSWTDPDDDTWRIDINWGDDLGTETINNLTARSFGPVNHIYDDGEEGGTARTISVTVTDGIGNTSDMTMVTVLNVDPTAIPGGPYMVDEGQTVELIGDGTDPGGSFDPLNYDWDLDNNDSFEVTFDRSPIFDATNLNNGDYTVQLRVSDDDNGTDTGSATVTVNNVPPTAALAGPFTRNEGESIVLDASGSSDPVDSLTYAWDFNNDGQFDDATGVMPTFFIGDDRTYPISVRVSDGDDSSDATTDIIALNIPPVADAGGPYTVDEGSTVVLDGSNSDDVIDFITFAWDLDNDSQFDDATVEMPTFDASALNNGIYDIVLRVDDGVDTDDSLSSVTVNNVAPTAVLSAPTSVLEGEMAALDASNSTDPVDDLTFAWDLDDDMQFDDAVGPMTTFDASVLTQGNYTVRVQVSDDVESVVASATIEVIDTSVPTVTIQAPDLTLTNTGPVTFPVSILSAATIDIGTDDVTLTPTGDATATVFVQDGTTDSPEIVLQNITGDGTLTIQIAAGVAQSIGSNPSLASNISSSVTIDNTAPVVTIAAPSPLITAFDPVEFAVSVDDPSATVDLSTNDIAVTSTNGVLVGNRSVTDGTTVSPLVTLSNITGDGTVRITIDPGIAVDAAGNASAQALSDPATIDHTIPTTDLWLFR